MIAAFFLLLNRSHAIIIRRIINIYNPFPIISTLLLRNLQQLSLKTSIRTVEKGAKSSFTPNTLSSYSFFIYILDL